LGDSSTGLPRSFSKIQKGRRVAIDKELLDLSGWQIGDQVMVEYYKGKFIIENLSRTIKPLPERLMTK